MTSTTMLENCYILEISSTELAESKGPQSVMHRVKFLDYVFNNQTKSKWWGQ